MASQYELWRKILEELSPGASNPMDSEYVLIRKIAEHFGATVDRLDTKVGLLRKIYKALLALP